MAIASQKELSRWLSGYMDELGFERRRIRERIHVYNRCSRAKDISTKQILKTNKIEKVFVGSMREGIGMDHFNDTDVLQINHAVICLADNGTINETGKLVFKMIQDKTPAGYTMLKLESDERNSPTFESINYALVRKEKGNFLSSKLFMTKNDDVFKSGDGIISRNTRYQCTQGPSIPKYVQKNLLQKHWLSKLNLTDMGYDFVRAFPCKADEILQVWKNRDRRSAWPSQKTINHVMSLPAYVVPVGQKDSINEGLQWRICFTMAETHLVQAFNNIQTKVFVLMKLIAKYILQPICKDITSYVVKMVMLWLAEKIPLKKFRRKHLCARLTDALRYLRTAVENKHLPSYMIPKRNLFAKKLTTAEQKLLIKKLNFLLSNGTKMIHNYCYDCFQHSEAVNEVCDSLHTANLISKVQSCIINLFSTEQFAEYNMKMFLYRSWWNVYLYNALFVWPPFFYVYGRRGFTDPLSFELSSHFAESERKEKAALQQMQNRNVSLTESSQKLQWQEWHLNTYMKDKFGLSLEKLVLSVILMLLLFVYGRSFLKILQTFLDTQCSSQPIIACYMQNDLRHCVVNPTCVN